MDVLYHNLPSYQPEHTGDLMEAEEMRAALTSTERITFPPESVGEMTMVSLTPPVLVGVRVITSLTSLALVVEPALPGVVTSPTSVVVGVLVIGTLILMIKYL